MDQTLGWQQDVTDRLFPCLCVALKMEMQMNAAPPEGNLLGASVAAADEFSHY